MIFPVERSNQKALIACAVIFSILPMTAVGLRLLARRMSNRKVDLSDYLMIAACVSLWSPLQNRLLLTLSSQINVVGYQALNISCKPTPPQCLET